MIVVLFRMPETPFDILLLIILKQFLISTLDEATFPEDLKPCIIHILFRNAFLQEFQLAKEK